MTYQPLRDSMTATVSIRQATQEDIPVLCDIIRRSFRDVAAQFSLTPENCPRHPSNCEESWIVRDMHDGAAYYVLTHGGDPVGCVVMRNGQPGECSLERLAVVPEARCHGLGQLLVEHVIGLATDQGLALVNISIIARHEKLRTWYQRLGFRETGVRTFPSLPFKVMFMTRGLRG